MPDDLISRQAAIKAIEDLQDCYNGFSDTYDKACIIGALEEVPSAQPERKTGKWIIVTDSRGQHAECQYCGEWKYHSNQKFCGECGARMEGEK